MAASELTLRANLTRDLTPAEVDANFLWLRSYATTALYAQQRDQGVYYVTDPTYNGGVVLNDASQASRNSDCLDALVSAIGNYGGTIILPIGLLHTARTWNLNKNFLTIEGQNTGMSSHVYSHGILGGSHLIFTGTGNAIDIDAGNGSSTEYVRGIMLHKFGIATNRAVRDGAGRVTNGAPARDSDTCGVRIGLSDNVNLDYLSITQIGRAVNAASSDTPKLTRLWICEAGAGIDLGNVGGTGFHAHVTGCTIADLGGRDGQSPNGGYGIRIANGYHQALVNINTFARNTVNVHITGNSYWNQISDNTFKESNGIGVLIDGINSNANVVADNIIQAAKAEAIVVNGGEFNSIQCNSIGNNQTGIINIVIGSDARNTIVHRNPANVGIQDNGQNSEITLSGSGGLLNGSGVATAGTFFQEDSPIWNNSAGIQLQRPTELSDQAKGSGGNFYFDNTTKLPRWFKLKGTGFALRHFTDPGACSQVNISIYEYNSTASDGGASTAVSYGSYSQVTASYVPVSSADNYNSVGKGPALDPNKTYVALITPVGAGTMLWDFVVITPY